MDGTFNVVYTVEADDGKNYTMVPEEITGFQVTFSKGKFSAPPEKGIGRLAAILNNRESCCP